MSRSLDTICPPLVQAELEVRELSLVGYDNALRQGYPMEERRRSYEEQFSKKKAKAYGVFVDGTLACSAWTLYGKMILTEEKVLVENGTCALLLDDYRFPAFRGRGFHGYLNQWRSNEMKINGAQKAYVIMLSYNRPVIRTQRRRGMEIEKVFYVYTSGKKVFIKGY